MIRFDGLGSGALALLAVIGLGGLGCAGKQPRPDTIDGVEVFDPSAAEVAKPEFRQSKFKVYWVYQPQVQRRDFNGVFDIFPDEARLVSRYWSQKFVALTRENYYEDFFQEFYENMASFAQTYAADTREKEKILDRLERHFQLFCANKGVEDEFLAFQARQAAILGG
ncbi:MAG: hypothetical protein AB7O52_03975 [Planctomycetota bacterium]